MEIKELLELGPIIIVSALLVLFISLYFVGTKKQKKLKASIKNLYTFENVKNMNEKINCGGETEDGMTAELVEQLRIINAQLDLMFELSPAFIICYDFARNYFYISENGRSQLGYTPETIDENINKNGETDQYKLFESLIHKDSVLLYEEITNFEDIRNHEKADSPYIIKIKDADKDQYGEYLMRVRPIYDEDGINKAFVAAFINTLYIENKKEYDNEFI